MSDSPFDDDTELRGLAMAAFHEHERSVSAAETEAALGAVRSRIDAGDLGGTSPVLFTEANHRRGRSPWLLAAAAAAVVGMVGAGLVAVVGTGSGTQQAATSLPPADATVTSAPDAPEASAVDVPATTSPPAATTSVLPGVADDVPGDDPGQLAIVNNCSVDSQCTLLANTEDGRIVAYDPSVDAFLVYDEAGRELRSEVPLVESLALAQPFIEHIGPDDVIYVTMPSADALDPIRDLLAIPLTGSNAGAVVMRWTGLDGSGDSVLVPRKTGLSSVGCCGPRVPRPSADEVIYRYVDRDGARIESTAPTFRLDLGEAGSNLARINRDGSSTFFALPTVLQNPRDFPDAVATVDGGALALDYNAILGRLVLVRFRGDWPEFGIDNADVFIADESMQGVSLLEPGGTVIVSADDRFVRRTLDELATPGWPGAPEIGVETGTLTAPGLNEHIAADQPSWAQEPDLLAVQFEQFIGANELVQSDFDAATGVLTVTTSGQLDDSSGAVRMTIRTERADDGLLRFVSGTYGWQCQPGRGHQDFSIELCS